MSLQQVAARALAAVEHSRSLFATAPASVSTAGAALEWAAQSSADAGWRAAALSGELADRHRAFVGTAARTLSDHSRTDAALERHLRTAAAVTQSGARQLDTVVAHTRAIVQTAGTARTPAAQRAVVATLRNQVTQADAVVNTARQQASAIAGQIRALGYGGRTASFIGDPPLDIPDEPRPVIGDRPSNVNGTPEQTHDDLGATIPGTGIRLGGDGDNRDGQDGYPRVHIPGVYDGPNPLPVPPGTRPLPTGTALGPNGEWYAFYAIVPYDHDGFTMPDTVVVDLAHPDRIVATLPGISQASGAYDAATGQMIVVGNTLDGQRAMWRSDPLAQNPNWISTVNTAQPRLFTGAMNGNRESQIVALPHGGFMLVGAADGLPVEGVVAPTPDGLFEAQSHALVGQIPDEIGSGWAYGPTITDITFNPETGQWETHMRVSTWTGGRFNYNPKTYDVGFTGTN